MTSKWTNLQNAWGGWEAAKDQGSFRLQTSQGQSYLQYSVKGTVHSSKQSLLL